MKKVIAFLADGFETVEALTVVDVLRRANVCVDTVSVMEDEYVTTAQNILIKADRLLCDVDISDYDMIFLPGGGGYKHLLENETVMSGVESFVKNGKLVSAICAAPSILGRMGLLEGKNATCFPGFEKYMLGANVTGEPVVTDGNIITGKGMGVSTAFALAVLSSLCGSDIADEIGKQIQFF